VLVLFSAETAIKKSSKYFLVVLYRERFEHIFRAHIQESGLLSGGIGTACRTLIPVSFATSALKPSPTAWVRLHQGASVGGPQEASPGPLYRNSA
jgi:hypothetical protein